MLQQQQEERIKDPWVKEVNNKKYWKLLVRCLLKSDEEIHTRPNDEGWNQTPRPQPQPAPCPTPERRRQRITSSLRYHGEDKHRDDVDT